MSTGFLYLHCIDRNPGENAFTWMMEGELLELGKVSSSHEFVAVVVATE